MSECAVSSDATKDDNRGSRVASFLSLPAFRILSERDSSETPKDTYAKSVVRRREKKVKSERSMAEEEEEEGEEVVGGATVVQVHPSPERSRSSRSRKTSSRHERHRCHKWKRSKPADVLQLTNLNLLERINELKRENYLLSKKVNASVTSLDSGLSQFDEALSPFEVDVNSAYQHVKNENARLAGELDKLRERCAETEERVEAATRENRDLDMDVTMLKGLVYKLNVELERYQSRGGNGGSEPRPEILPENHHKNFLRPLLPLLRAYSEAVHEKNDIIDNLDAELKKFGLVFNDLLKENEKLYAELERKMNTVEGDAASRVKVLERDLEMAKQENSLLVSQIQLEQEKLEQVHSVYRMKVAEVLKQNEAANESLQEQKADLYMMRGKYSILKQEFERLKVDSESKVPMAVHSASIGECKRLFQDLKNEYETQRQHHLATISEQEQVVSRLRKRCDECARNGSRVEERTRENEALRKRLAEIEGVAFGGGGGDDDLRRQLRDSNARIDELSGKLASTKKQLSKAMSFAEDIVREQESLLVQLHAKQKENTYMVTRFGSLRKQLKSVEKGAQEGLDSVEERMKALELENSKLSGDLKKTKSLLREKDDIIARLERGKDSNS